MSFFASEEYKLAQDQVENFLKDHFASQSKSISEYSPQLVESMQYSLFTGGKRFRPVLCLLTTRALGGSMENALPFATALELVHTYSLIHDDLPCMDNDKERRGQPTNHIKFGEPLALLAGDALLTEAFSLIANSYSAQPFISTRLVNILGKAAGAGGMVGGQAMDMGLGRSIDSVVDLEKMHRGKTAALISAALSGVGPLMHLTTEEQEQLEKIGYLLGMAFQIKDDLLDEGEDEPEKSYVSMIGAEKTKAKLNEINESCRTHLRGMPQLKHTIELFLQANSERSL